MAMLARSREQWSDGDIGHPDLVPLILHLIRQLPSVWRLS